MVLRSMKSLKPGELICENYGPIFTIMDREERQNQLASRYWFGCQCVPCNEDWPKFSDLRPDDINLVCERCQNRLRMDILENITNPNVKCEKCQHYTNIMKSLKSLGETQELFEKGSALSGKGEMEHALKVYLKLLKILEGILAQPHKDYYLAHEAVRKCMMHAGNKFIVQNKERQIQ